MDEKMQVRLTPADVDTAITRYVRELFVGNWEAKVIHMHKNFGVTVEMEYLGIKRSANQGSAREPVLQRVADETDLLEQELMGDITSTGEMVEL